MISKQRQLAAPPALLDNSSPEAADNFRSVLIIAYEQALEEGIAPGAAIGIVLDWLTLELKRCSRPSHDSR
jgi:hypothetical protein